MESPPAPGMTGNINDGDQRVSLFHHHHHISSDVRIAARSEKSDAKDVTPGRGREKNGSGHHMNRLEAYFEPTQSIHDARERVSTSSTATTGVDRRAQRALPSL